jgi:hypothetical protein
MTAGPDWVAGIDLGRTDCTLSVVEGAMVWCVVVVFMAAMDLQSKLARNH